MKTKPIVALVGRPNVGKSTLFNRLAGEQLAIVDATPGTTRDRIFSSAEWNGLEFDIVDTGGIDPSTSRAGREPLSIGSADFIEGIRAQAELAIKEADAVLFLVDAISGVTPADREVAEILRKSQTMREGKPWPPIFLVVNKADSQNLRENAPAFYELGMGEPYAISALHGTGTGDLLDDLVASFPPQEEEEEDDSIKIAIVGKPNAGKSSLLNRILGEERALVSPIPGTTRDAIDTPLVYDGLKVTLIDTAGIRRRGKVEPGVEKYSVLRSMRAIERSDVVLLVIDATSGITAQDTHIAGYIMDAWKSTVVLVNKWDLVEKDNQTMQMYTRKIREELNFMDYVPILFISAKTGQRVDQVMPLALRVQEERLARLTTGQVNRIIQEAQSLHAPPSKGGRALHIYYGTQVRSDPPTFLLFCNDPSLAHFSYMRFLENIFRKEYPFTGTPIRLVLKARR
ncbi:MAG TPA: ribosome biogenesis GTPase Der [Anaerolinea thermolimosa]|uniref:GTPase Der n=1 Tax=Anaerolinea thermolimosa TaxID=229919 RepID=A0A3D1JJ60_9CHLR|nr:ribosome biogenesis GTPase Der [Anaerolinea thermolimosa]GAP07411.1 ribosome-associated GTPase EngA [Anaerolinea thermolimosa]HCE18621.1 ribosome biogenesis GTPase Der [Anaerolinea thermolimosa]